MIVDLPHPLAVVAHDAGAANHIYAWLDGEQASVFLSGPAKEIWHERSGQINQSNMEATISKAALLITGTGWGSNLEHDARRLARNLGIKSVAVIDHWTNYHERFSREGDQVLPDEIWVSDPYALKIAQATFPTINVVQQPNDYLSRMVAEVESQQTTGAVYGNDRVLYVLEPIRQAWGTLAIPGEFEALNYFMHHRALAHVAPNAEIRLRPHPSDPPGKYDAWLKSQVNPLIVLDSAPTLAASLAWANIVAGCQTYAMVLGLGCGRTVISSIPAWAPPCILPHLDIIRLSRLCEPSI